ncbi:MAG TPA: hypothetical protein DCE56_37945 [Cyanobacteria bacterium UBA8553]|nr:hypothetical protein [Cyanobacteria bacterium UBA8553]HAJ59006.1 hypothetical protein [Cyanobacteria bacterium UBA8543]
MSGENRKLKKPIWVNFAVVTLMLVTTGFTITGCVQTKPKSESAKPAGQSTKPVGEPTKQEKKNQSAKSAKQKDVPPDKIEETTIDDDPE